jgi:hypothetical protein
MFFPQSEIASGAAAINRDKQWIRDYFDLPVEEECVDYYVKKDYFVPRSAHQLEIVITAWKDSGKCNRGCRTQTVPGQPG